MKGATVALLLCGLLAGCGGSAHPQALVRQGTAPLSPADCSTVAVLDRLPTSPLLRSSVSVGADGRPRQRVVVQAFDPRTTTLAALSQALRRTGRTVRATETGLTARGGTGTVRATWRSLPEARADDPVRGTLQLAVPRADYRTPAAGCLPPSPAVSS